MAFGQSSWGGGLLKVVEGQTLESELSRLLNRANFEVQEISQKKSCLVCFSGNGIYYPDSLEVLKAEIGTRDHYEWKNIARSGSIRRRFGRIVFIRDLQKTWYCRGISNSINTLDGVHELLTTLTSGCEITTVGNSAGGYAAVLFGCLLGAQRIFTFSGQFDVGALLDVRCRAQGEPIPKSAEVHSDLLPLVSAQSSRVFYFFPAGCSEDKRQASKASESDRVVCFAVETAVHGETLMGTDLISVLTGDDRKLLRLHTKLAGSAWHRSRYHRELTGPVRRAFETLHGLVRQIYQRFRSHFE